MVLDRGRRKGERGKTRQPKRDPGQGMEPRMHRQNCRDGSAIRKVCRKGATSANKTTGSGKNAASIGQRIGRIEGERGEISTTGAEGGEDPQPYVPNWPQVTMNSNLPSAKKNLEWLLNCVPSGVSEGYETLRAGSVIELGIQSALLVREPAEINVRKKETKSKLIKFFCHKG